MSQDTSAYDFVNRPIVGEPLSERVIDLLFWSREFIQEIEWWFSLRDRLQGPTQYPQSLVLRKPICIELYEFANYLCVIHTVINNIVKSVNAMYADAGREIRLPFVSGEVKRTAQGWKNRLSQPRNIIAAHRYTNKQGRFVTLNDIMAALKSLSWKELEKAREELLHAYEELEAWSSNPTNRDHLVLANDLAKRSQVKPREGRSSRKRS